MNQRQRLPSANPHIPPWLLGPAYGDDPSSRALWAQDTIDRALQAFDTGELEWHPDYGDHPHRDRTPVDFWEKWRWYQWLVAAWWMLWGFLIVSIAVDTHPTWWAKLITFGWAAVTSVLVFHALMSK